MCRKITAPTIEWYTPAGEPMGSGTFRGEAGVLYYANHLLREWAKQQSK